MKHRAAAQPPEVANGIEVLEASVMMARLVAGGLRDSTEDDPARLRALLMAATFALDYVADMADPLLGALAEGGAR